MAMKQDLHDPVAEPSSVMRLRGVTRSYSRQAVLSNLDLDVPAGSTLGLLGKNGAGKTTLIKCALGLIRPEAGSIEIFGEPAWTLSAEAKARLGYVPQVPQLYGWMRVRQILAYTGSFYPRWNEQLVARLALEWEIPLEQRCQTLSEGQAQKVAILLALGHEPDLLVLDEPAASLDPIARRDFLNTLLSLVADGRRTILFSTHITSDLERVADRVAIVKNGRVTYAGELDVLKDQVKRLHVTSPHGLPADFDFPGVLHSRISGNEALVSVGDYSPGLKQRIEAELGANVEVQDLNLEDIFVELHDGK
jgi:ABC-2 type transport system ATP-binding protein